MESKKTSSSSHGSFFLPKSTSRDDVSKVHDVTPLKRLQELNENIRVQNDHIRSLSYPSTPSPGGKGFSKTIAHGYDGSTQGLVLSSPTHGSRARSRPITKIPPVQIDVSVNTQETVVPPPNKPIDLTHLVEKVVENVVNSHEYVNENLKSVYQEKLELQKNMYNMENLSELARLRYIFEKDGQLVQNHRHLLQQQLSAEQECVSREKSIHAAYNTELNVLKRKYEEDIEQLHKKILEQDQSLQSHCAQQVQEIKDDQYKEMMLGKVAMQKEFDFQQQREQEKLADVRSLLETQEREFRVEKVAMEVACQDKVEQLSSEVHGLKLAHSEEVGILVLQHNRKEKELVQKYEEEIQRMKQHTHTLESTQQGQISVDAQNNSISLKTVETTLKRQVKELEEQVLVQNSKIQEQEKDNKLQQSEKLHHTDQYDTLVLEQSKSQADNSTKDSMLSNLERKQSNEMNTNSRTITVQNEKMEMFTSFFEKLTYSIRLDHRLRILQGKYKTYQRTNLPTLDTVCRDLLVTNLDSNALEKYVDMQETRIHTVEADLKDREIVLCCDKCACHCSCQTHVYNAGCQTEYAELVRETGDHLGTRGCLLQFKHDAETQTMLKLTDHMVPVDKSLLCRTCSTRVYRKEENHVEQEENIMIFNSKVFLVYFDNILHTFTSMKQSLQDHVSKLYNVSGVGKGDIASYNVLSSVIECDKLIVSCTDVQKTISYAVKTHTTLEDDVTKQICNVQTSVNKYMSVFASDLTSGIVRGLVNNAEEMLKLTNDKAELVQTNTTLSKELDLAKNTIVTKETREREIIIGNQNLSLQVKEIQQKQDTNLITLATAESQIRVLTGQLDASAVKTSQLLDEQKNLNVELDAANVALIVEKRKVSSLLLGVDGDKSEKESLQSTLTKLEEKKQQLETQLERYIESDGQKGTTIRDLEFKVEKMTLTHASQVRVLEEQVNIITTQSKTLSEKLASSETSLLNSEELVYDQKSRLSSLEHQADALLRKSNAGETKLDQITAKYKKLRKAYEEAKKFINQTKTDALRVQEDKTRLSEECKQIILLYDNHIAAHKTEMDELAGLFGISRESLVIPEEEEKEEVVAAFADVPSFELEYDSDSNESMLQLSTQSSIHSQQSNHNLEYQDIVVYMQQYCESKKLELQRSDKINHIFLTTLKSTLERICLAMEEYNVEKPLMETKMKQQQEQAVDFHSLVNLHQSLVTELEDKNTMLRSQHADLEHIKEQRHDQQHDNTKLVAELGECMRLNSIMSEEKVNLAEIAELARSELRICREMLHNVKTKPSGCYCDCNCCEPYDVMLDEKDAQAHYNVPHIPLVPNTQCGQYTNMGTIEQDQYTYHASSIKHAQMPIKHSIAKTTKVQQLQAKIVILEEYITSLEESQEGKLHTQLATLTNTQDKEFESKLEKLVAVECLRLQEKYELELFDKDQCVQKLEKQLLLQQKADSNKFEQRSMDVTHATQQLQSEKEVIIQLRQEAEQLQTHQLIEVGRMKAEYDANLRLLVQYHQEDQKSLETRQSKNIRVYEAEFKVQLQAWKKEWKDKLNGLENPLTHARVLAEQLEKMEKWVESMMQQEQVVSSDDDTHHNSMNEQFILQSAKKETFHISFTDLIAQQPPSVQLYLVLNSITPVQSILSNILHQKNSPKHIMHKPTEPLFQTRKYTGMSTETKTSLSHLTMLVKQQKNLGTNNAVIREACKPYTSAVLQLDEDCTPVFVTPSDRSVLPKEHLWYQNQCIRMKTDSFSRESQYVLKYDTTMEHKEDICCYPRECMYHWHEMKSIPTSPVFEDQDGILTIQDKVTHLHLETLVYNVQTYVQNTANHTDLQSKLQLLLTPLINADIPFSSDPTIKYESILASQDNGTQIQSIIAPIIETFATSLLHSNTLLREGKRNTNPVEKTVQTIVTTMGPLKK